jgi:PAS domain-containing protein
MRSQTVEQYGAMQWYTPFPVSMLIVSFVWFTRFFLAAGRRWMAWTITALRILVPLLNIFSMPNIRFAKITGLRRIDFLGETVSIAEGLVHPWAVITNLTAMLLMIFLIDAAIQLARRHARRIDIVLAGSAVFFTALGAVQSSLVDRGAIRMPYMVSFCFVGAFLVMAYGTSGEILRAMQLVTELKTSEASLRESEERMTLAAEAANLGIWINDLVKEEIWASDNWRVLFGFDKSERIDFDGILQRLHPEDRDRVRRLLASVLVNGDSYEVVYRLMLPGNEFRWIASTGRVEFDANGTPVRLRGVSVDITQRHLAELEVQQQRAELAHFSRVSMLGELSGSLAHELSQPLGAILRNTEAAELFLQEPSPDLEELRAILADIRSDDQRARAVIDRMRSMLKRREMEHSLLDLNVLADEVIGLVRRDADSRKVQLVLEQASAIPPLRGDRIQLQQVLLNLLLNAMDALKDTEPAQRLVTVRVRVEGKVRRTPCERHRSGNSTRQVVARL